MTYPLVRIAMGRSKGFGGKQSCKIVTVILGDNPACYKEIELVNQSIIHMRLLI